MAPANDLITNATVISADTTGLAGTTVAATTTGETFGGDYYKLAEENSVWYKLIIPADFYRPTVTAVGSGGFKPYLQYGIMAYNQSPNSSNLRFFRTRGNEGGDGTSTPPPYTYDFDGFSYPWNRNYQRLQAGDEIYLYVSKYGGSDGAFTLDVTFDPPPADPTGGPPNDNFADATVLTGTSGDIFGDTTIDATADPAQPVWINNPEVWYKFVATAPGRFLFTTTYSPFYGQAYLYKGEDILNLVMYQNGLAGDIDYDLIPGTWYVVLTYDYSGTQEYDVSWSFVPVPDIVDEAAAAASFSRVRFGE